MVITINVSDDQIKLAEALAKWRMMTTGKASSRSQEFGRAIERQAEDELPAEDLAAITQKVAA